ncbi:MAG: hypothetical protein IJE26_04395 [Oscillospiraceae bacterium]|nr:hypothetical protein [Oscillospiraceae bacterium]
MRKRANGAGVAAWIAITAGLIVLLSMILPPGFWWFMLGVALIALGLCIRRRC